MIRQPLLLVLLTATVSMLLSGGATACDSTKMASAKMTARTMSAGKDIVQTASAAGSFNTLLAAAEAAGLVDALKGDGPLTVFAPTDEAFAKLPAGTVETLLEPENRDRLAAILTYHVAPGRLPASAVVERPRITTLNGQRPKVEVSAGAVRVGEARVVSADIATSNGIIHVIDSVLLPSSSDIVKTAVGAGGFDTLATALNEAELVGALQGEGPFTVFAPVDSAFAALPKAALADLLEKRNRAELTEVLTFHVVPGRIYSDDILAGAELKTLQGSTLAVNRTRSGVRIGQAGLIKTDIETANGVIHVIDSILMPAAENAHGNARRAALDLIDGAISRGAPLYNDGHADACTAVYETVAAALVSLPSDMLDSSERRRLERAMSELRRTHDAESRAWVMREGLDDVARSLARKM